MAEARRALSPPGLSLADASLTPRVQQTADEHTRQGTASARQSREWHTRHDARAHSRAAAGVTDIHVRTLLVTMRSSLKVLVRHHVASRICLCVRAQLSSRQHIPLPLACARCTSRSLKHHAHPAPTPTAQSQTGTPPPGAPIASRSPALSRASPACPRVPPPRLQRPCAPQARVRRPPCKRARERARARWGPSVPAAPAAAQKPSKSAESSALQGLASVTMVSAGSHSYLVGSNFGGLKAAPRCA